MTITVQHLGLRSVHRTDATIENAILALRDLVVIDEARVRLERHPDRVPAYSVRVHLATPGPGHPCGGHGPHPRGGDPEGVSRPASAD